MNYDAYLLEIKVLLNAVFNFVKVMTSELNGRKRLRSESEDEVLGNVSKKLIADR